MQASRDGMMSFSLGPSQRILLLFFSPFLFERGNTNQHPFKARKRSVSRTSFKNGQIPDEFFFKAAEQHFSHKRNICDAEELKWGGFSPCGVTEVSLPWLKIAKCETNLPNKKKMTLPDKCYEQARSLF